MVEGYDFEDDSKKKIKIDIQHIPVMINQQGDVVCIPKSVDLPTIGISGIKGTGKSYLGHGIIDRIFWYWKQRIFIINDMLNENNTWSKPNISDRTKLSPLHESPKPLPCVYLYPDNNRFIKPNHDYLKMSIPFDFVLDNLRFFIDIKSSKKYISAIKEELLSCSSFNEISQAIESIENSNVRDALNNTFLDFLEEGICDVTSKAPAYLDTGMSYSYRVYLDPIYKKSYREKYPISVRKYGPAPMTVEQIDYYSEANLEPINRNSFWAYRTRYPIFLAILRQGLIPVLKTRDIRIKEYFQSYMKYIIETTFMNQSKGEFDRFKYSIWLLVDELTAISATDNKGPCTDAIKMTVAQGRPSRIGVVWLTQNYSKVDKIIRSNTTYLFAMRFKSKAEVKLIQDDFELSDYMRDNLLRLGKHEVQAMTTESFVCYTPNGDVYTTNEPQIGKSLPTLSLHKKPKEVEIR